MNPKSISIIGSGIGGLSAAIRLAHSGLDVTIYEKNSTPGGKARTFQNDGFRFDTGPSLLTMPFVIEELFSSAGVNINDYLSVKKLDVLCKYFYPDKTVINAWSDTDKFAAEIESNSADPKENLYRYLDYCKTIYELTADIFLFHDLYSISTYTNTKALKTLFKLPKIDSFRTMNKANRAFFRDEKIIQLFNRYATYNGSNPYLCPATLNIIPYVEYCLGGYYIEEGMFKLTEALYKLALDRGVRFQFNSAVSKIVTENRNVKGIEVSGKFIASDIVISNADVHLTYSRLLGDNRTGSARKYISLEPSSSALVFYWGVKIDSGKLETHNILFSGDYKNEFTELFDKKIYPADPTVYIYISSKFAPGDAPTGHENWFVMINAPNENYESGINNYENTKDAIIAKIARLTGYDISDKIVCESIMTPRDIEEQTGSFKGSIYGISSNNRKSAFMRQRNKSRHYRGLCFAGGSAHPGGGIPLVILSGKLCADAIVNSLL